MTAADAPVAPPVFGTTVAQGWHAESSDHAATAWSQLLDNATRAEELGYGLLVVSDHFVNVPAPRGKPVFECWTTLTALACATERIRLGQLATCNSFRDPGLVAKITSTLDVLSGGRLEWGVGAGWYRDEHRAYGLSFPPLAERVDRLTEAVDVVCRLWREPSVSHHGRFHRLDGAECEPKPLQRPRPPVWIAGSSAPVLDAVVALGDRCNFGGPLERWTESVRRLEERCAAAGRDPATITKTWSGQCLVRSDEREIHALIEDGSVGPALADKSPDEWMATSLVGTPDTVAERIAGYVEAGCEWFVPFFADLPGATSMELFAEEVLPRFGAREEGGSRRREPVS